MHVGNAAAQPPRRSKLTTQSDHIGVDAKTLRKHFRDELDRGSVEATAKVAQTLFHLATVDKNVAPVIF